MIRQEAEETKQKKNVLNKTNKRKNSVDTCMYVIIKIPLCFMSD